VLLVIFPSKQVVIWAYKGVANDGYEVTNGEEGWTHEKGEALPGVIEQVKEHFPGFEIIKRDILEDADGPVPLGFDTNKLLETKTAGKREFKQWFGESKVVNYRGEPLVVYHGSSSPWVVQFDVNMAGRGWAGRSSKFPGIWFTSSRRNASWFTDKKRKHKAVNLSFYGDYEKVWYADVEDRFDASIFQCGPFSTKEEAEVEGKKQMKLYNKHLYHDTFITSAYLKIENPLVVNVVPRDAEFTQAKAEGRDGIIAKNVADGIDVSDVYIVFDSAQIRKK